MISNLRGYAHFISRSTTFGYTSDDKEHRHKLIDCLRQSRKRRKPQKKGGAKRTTIRNLVSIHDRPYTAVDRKEPGHWEGDLVIGKDHKSAIGTLVERKTRFTYILKLANKKSNTVTSAFSKALNSLDANWRKTLTYDNGVEMAYHHKLTAKTGMDVYFAHPYSFWERGTNENTNGLIRRYLTKGANFHQITQEQLMHIQHRLNNRPRKILGYKTPLEAMKLCA